MRAGDFILKQSKLLLENKQHAILCAVLLSIIPFASWLSVALVALITLRKGAKSGFDVLLPAMVVHSAPLMLLLPFEGVFVNTLIAYVPCYLAAITLRKTSNWSAVCGMFFIQALVAFLLIQLVTPQFAMDQFEQLKKLLAQYEAYQQVLKAEDFNATVWAQILFGVQILSVAISSVISLFFARSIQAKLFLPGGFKQELLDFKSGQLSAVAFVVVSFASYLGMPCALNVLPLLLCYFLAWGAGLSSLILARKKQSKLMILLLLLMVFKPIAMLSVYIVFGFLDSLFQFKFYYPDRVKESI